MNFFKRLFTPKPKLASYTLREAKFIATSDEQVIRCRHPDGYEESIRWDQLTTVIIETNDTGPLGTDVFLLLLGADAKSGCAIPQGATGEDELIEKLQLLPGFDNDQAIAAMCSVQNKRFLCWSRPQLDR